MNEDGGMIQVTLEYLSLFSLMNGYGGMSMRSTPLTHIGRCVECLQLFHLALGNISIIYDAVSSGMSSYSYPVATHGHFCYITYKQHTWTSLTNDTITIRYYLALLLTYVILYLPFFL
jgi:hypothetical protein